MFTKDQIQETTPMSWQHILSVARIQKENKKKRMVLRMKDSTKFEKGNLTIGICTLNELSSIKTIASLKNQMVTLSAM